MKISDLPTIEPKAAARDERNPKLLAAARMYEKQFLREMVQAMRRTVENGGLIETSMGEQVFRDKLDEEYVDVWGDKGGIGLSDLIYNQVAERYGLDSRQRLQKTNGPLPLSNTPIKQVSQHPQNLEFQVQLETGSDSQVQSPFAGRILATGPLSDGRTLIRVGHDGDVVSEFKFRGRSVGLGVGAEVEEKTPLGLLSDTRFEWSLNSKLNR